MVVVVCMLARKYTKNHEKMQFLNGENEPNKNQKKTMHGRQQESFLVFSFFSALASFRLLFDLTWLDFTFALRFASACALLRYLLKWRLRKYIQTHICSSVCVHVCVCIRIKHNAEWHKSPLWACMSVHCTTYMYVYVCLSLCMCFVPLRLY